MKQKHTPSPWINKGQFIIDTHNRGIATCYIMDGHGLANARLITAVPDYHEWAYNLAMLILQSDLYYKDYEVKKAVDTILSIWREVEEREK